jgi:histidyl-tRNA synthetase
LNSRKILAGIVDTLGESARFVSFAVALDKLDKIGWDKVADELVQNGFCAEKVEALKELVLFEGTNEAKLAKLTSFFGTNETGLQGLAEIKEVLSLSETNGFSNDNLVFDYKLARGLSYYTGLIYEGKAVDLPFGSIVGGGRYDDLTSSFGLPNMSGVGISFGIERILDVMEELSLFPEISTSASAILFTYFDVDGRKAALGMANELRKVGIPSEVYPDVAKIKKSFEFADKKKIAFVAVIGESELKEGKASVKNMKNGEQNLLSIAEIITLLK